MSRLFFILVVVLGLVGCQGLPQEVKVNLHTQQVALSAFVEQMDAGKTTREVEQAMLREAQGSLLVLDWAVNDDEEAKALWDKLQKAAAQK
jgi:hypothetical protein